MSTDTPSVNRDFTPAASADPAPSLRERARAAMEENAARLMREHKEYVEREREIMRRQMPDRLSHVLGLNVEPRDVYFDALVGDVGRVELDGIRFGCTSAGSLFVYARCPGCCRELTTLHVIPLTDLANLHRCVKWADNIDTLPPGSCIEACTRPRPAAAAREPTVAEQLEQLIRRIATDEARDVATGG